MATITFRTKEIGLNEPIRLKENGGLQNKTRELALKVTEWQTKATKAELKALDDNTDIKIAELTKQVNETKDEIEKLKLQKEVKRLKLQKELKTLESTGSDLDQANQMKKDFIDGIVKFLELDDKQSEIVRDKSIGYEEIGQYIGYLNSRSNGMSDEEYDKAISKAKLEEKVSPKKG